MGWIKGFVGLSLIDYPDKIAAAVFCGGCPFRCPFCHNVKLVLDPAGLPDYREDDILARLESRCGFCDGVVISGGEPLMHPGLELFVRKLKSLGFSVKLDTNGYYPEPLARLLDSGLLDFVSMDLKSTVKKYAQAAGVQIDWWRIERAITLLNRSQVKHEFRTTLVPGLVNRADLVEMALILGQSAPWVLQPFRPLSTLEPGYTRLAPYSEAETGELLRQAQTLKANVSVRLDFDPADRHFNQKAVSITA